MLIPKKVKIKGFRGFLKEKEFSFNLPMILFFGENHYGKSSTLNAIEWGLFGNECIGKNTGIRERIDWEIRNRNLPQKDEVWVEIELEDENKNYYCVSRKLISKTKDELKIILPDKRVLRDEKALEKLSQIIRSSFRDFITTVYQHQEAIRAILTQEQKDRNDAIDRLLGLSDYRNILSGIKAANLDGRQKAMEKDLDNFKEEIERNVHLRERDYSDKREEAIQEGLKENQLNKQGAQEIAQSARDDLVAFSLDIGLSFKHITNFENLQDLDKFNYEARHEISDFRSKLPDAKEQNELYQHQTRINSLTTDYEQKSKNLKEASQELEKCIRIYGDTESLQKRKTDLQDKIIGKEKEMKELNAKGSTISQAIDYLKLEGINRNMCPVCGKKTPDLIKKLEEEWDQKYEQQIGKIKKEIESMNNEVKESIKSWRKLITIEENVSTINTEYKNLIRDIEQELKREITKEDDPLVLLNTLFEKNKKRLETLEKFVQDRNGQLNKIDVKLNQLKTIIDILKLEQKMKIVEEISNSKEYQKIERLKDQYSILVDKKNQIMDAINQASLEEAKNKIDSAGDMINKYFCKIANNPAISKINLLVDIDKRTGKNNFEFRDQEQRELTPILSQGDLNALALSIFLSMACMGEKDCPFGMIMLDDPSQSLGSEHKKNLINILDEVLKEKQIILSTMDKELQNLISSKITKAKEKYIFTDWTPEKGPEVRKE